MLFPPPLTITPVENSIVPQRIEQARASLIVWLKDSGAQTQATASDRKYTVIITRHRQIIYIRNDMPGLPAYAGIWMDFPEKHWNITRYKYHKLPEGERAKLEAHEQLRHVVHEFEQLWVETWFPDDYYSYWWYRGGAALSMRHRERPSNIPSWRIYLNQPASHFDWNCFAIIDVRMFCCRTRKGTSPKVFSFSTSPSSSTYVSLNFGGAEGTHCVYVVGQKALTLF